MALILRRAISVARPKTANRAAIDRLRIDVPAECFLERNAEGGEVLALVFEREDRLPFVLGVLDVL